MHTDIMCIRSFDVYTRARECAPTTVYLHENERFIDYVNLKFHHCLMNFYGKKYYKKKREFFSIKICNKLEFIEKYISCETSTIFKVLNAL